MEKILRVNNQLEELTRVQVFLEQLSSEWRLSLPLVYTLNLVLEEALNNINDYGFNDGCNHSIEIIFNKTGNDLTISIIDDGREYDPTLKTDPDITLPARDRPIGGLGIFLIKKNMDKVEYHRKGNKNWLVLTKKTGS